VADDVVMSCHFFVICVNNGLKQNIALLFNNW